MGNRKVLLIVVIAVVVLAVGAVVATFLGVDLFATVSGEAGKQPDAFSSVDDLKSGKAYVWHHDGGDIKEDLKKLWQAWKRVFTKGRACKRDVRIWASKV